MGKGGTEHKEKQEVTRVEEMRQLEMRRMEAGRLDEELKGEDGD